ncbi:MAG: hypothetical protein V1689_13765 [Pseudomonadota bacterium]
MGKAALTRSLTLLCPLVGACLLLGGSCNLKRTPSPEEERTLPIVENVVVVGFRAAISPGGEPEVVRDPLTGAIFSAEAVPNNVTQEMNESLFEMLAKEKRYQLISPNQARGVLAGIAGLESDMGAGPLEILRKVGKRFGADAVAAGYIYRWREREGGDYAVNRPASVAFDLHLVRPADGAILWKGRFDKTQRSLSENIFDLGTFIQGGGVWMTAQKLAMLGLGKLVAEMSAATRGGGE